jgi:hypothetical protein
MPNAELNFPEGRESTPTQGQTGSRFDVLNKPHFAVLLFKPAAL